MTTNIIAVKMFCIHYQVEISGLAFNIAFKFSFGIVLLPLHVLIIINKSKIFKLYLSIMMNLTKKSLQYLKNLKISLDIFL